MRRLRAGWLALAALVAAPAPAEGQFEALVVRQLKFVGNHAIDGESLVPLFKGGKQLARSAIFWHFPGYLNGANSGSRDQLFRTRPVTTIHKGDWKLHLFHEEWALDGGRDRIDKNKSVELYNLASDIGERRDLALERKEKRDELLGDVLAWFERVDAKLPTEANARYDPSADPSGSTGKKKRRARRKK